MITEEFRAICLARFGERWQAGLDRWLVARGHATDRRTIRRWAAGEAPIPDWLAALLGAGQLAAPEPPEWLLGEPAADPPAEDGSVPSYVVHSRAPRFIARIVADDEAEAASCDLQADRLGGITGSFAGLLLCEIAWIDPPPSGDLLLDLLRRAATAVVEDVALLDDE